MSKEKPSGLVAIKRKILTADDLYDDCRDWVINEQAIALVYNGISHAVMMATPTHLLDFAIGFSLAEQIIQQASDITDYEIVEQAQGIEVQMTINSRLFTALKRKRRSLAGNSGCGLCGVESLQQTVKKHPPLTPKPIVSFQQIKTALHAFQSLQRLNKKAGGVHGAAFFSLETSQLLCLREDVGRHNALDKLIGALVQDNIDLAQGFVVASSRASYEMVDKTIAAGISHLVTMSAATSKAIDCAKQHNLNLIGFARDKRQVVY